MKTKSLTLAVALVFGALAAFATPAQAGGRKHHKKQYNNYYNNGWNNSCGYFPQRNYHRPVRYYQPARYYQPLPRPVIQFGFSFGGRPGC